MKNKSKKIIFFGNEKLATGVSTKAPVLAGLIKNGWTVACVVINFEPPRSRTKRQFEVAELANTHGIPLLTPQKISDVLEELKAFDASAGVLAAYGKIIPESVIDIFPTGIINIHPSLLPAHRGPTPIESVILDGANETGISLMKLSGKMDAGPIYAQKKIGLTGTETKQELSDKLSLGGAEILLQSLPDILDGKNQGQPQDELQATYDQLLTKEDGKVDWTKPAAQIEREIRAYAGWPNSRTTLAGHNLIISQAKVVNETGIPGEYRQTKDRLVVFCGHKALEIISIKPEGKKAMPIGAFLRGYSLNST